MLLRFHGRESSAALALAVLVFWAPIPAGSITPGAELLFRVGALAIALVALTGEGHPWPRSRSLPVAALAGVALLGLLQSCRFPTAVAALVSQEHARLHLEAAALVPGVATPSSVPLSLVASASRSSAISWLVAAALLATALVAGRRRHQRRWLLIAVVAAALLQLGLGLMSLQASSPAGLTLLLRPEGRLRGTFANPNHLSLLLEMAMATAAAWIWLELTARSRAVSRRLVRALAPLCLWLVFLIGVVLTGSRAGLAAAGAGFAVQLAFMLLAGGGRGSRLTALTLCLVMAALIALGARFEIRRYESASVYEDNLQGRLLAVRPALELWARFPATGTGLGTFEDSFPMVSPPELTRGLLNRAHNSPLELLVTGGVVGLALGLLAVASLLPPILRAARYGPGGEDRAAGVAALGVLAAVGFHELLDFGLVMPANHLVLLVVLGSGAAAGLNPPAARRASA